MNDIINPITEEQSAPQEKLCIDCKHIATSISHDWRTYRCMAPQNPSSLNLVTGDKIYKVEFCTEHRAQEPFESLRPDQTWRVSCTTKANWWEKKPILAPLIPQPDLSFLSIRKTTKQSTPISAEDL